MGVEKIDLKLSEEEAESDEKLDSKGKFDFEKFLQKNKLSVILGGLGVFLLGIGILSTVVLSSKKESSSIEILPLEDEKQDSEIFIHVSGAVQKPGLYKLSSNTRINDALTAAGGLASEANREWFNKSVNLAQKLSDGVKLYIPFQGEISRSRPGLEQQSSGVVAGEQTSIFSQETQGKININAASVSQLGSLPGIGPSYAQRIIDSRPFSKIEDIMNVPGIGEKTFEKIKDQISVF